MVVKTTFGYFKFDTSKCNELERKKVKDKKRQWYMDTKCSRGKCNCKNPNNPKSKKRRMRKKSSYRLNEMNYWVSQSL